MTSLRMLARFTGPGKARSRHRASHDSRDLYVQYDTIRSHNLYSQIAPLFSNSVRHANPLAVGLNLATGHA